MEGRLGPEGEVLVDLNVDGAGHREGGTSFSPLGLPPGLESALREAAEAEGLSEGPWWPQGDHSVFAQAGVPAVAFTSTWFLEHMESQRVTHTPEDRPGIVEPRRLAELARALADFVRRAGAC